MCLTSSTLSNPLMRRMNSILLGHHGASARTDCMYLAMARLSRRVIPGQRQVYDPRLNLHRVDGRQRLLAAPSEDPARARAAAVGYRNGPAGNEYPGSNRRCPAVPPLPTTTSAHARATQFQIQNQGPVFHQEISISGAPIEHRGTPVSGAGSRRMGESTAEPVRRVRHRARVLRSVAAFLPAPFPPPRPASGVKTLEPRRDCSSATAPASTVRPSPRSPDRRIRPTKVRPDRE